MRSSYYTSIHRKDGSVGTQVADMRRILSPERRGMMLNLEGSGEKTKRGTWGR
jgi:hypothetical protein